MILPRRRKLRYGAGPWPQGGIVCDVEVEKG
jgi:hypothetical protein